jgi:hypothetical protein
MLWVHCGCGAPHMTPHMTLPPVVVVALHLQVVEEDEFIAAMHASAEKFDDRAEHTFGYLQVRQTCGRRGAKAVVPS